jgi:hypothetical protein
MIPGFSRNWRRTSCTMVPAVRDTARMAREENRKATEPPISRPMKVFGSATLICTREASLPLSSACSTEAASMVPRATVSA